MTRAVINFHEEVAQLRIGLFADVLNFAGIHAGTDGKSLSTKGNFFGNVVYTCPKRVIKARWDINIVVLIDASLCARFVEHRTNRFIVNFVRAQYIGFRVGNQSACFLDVFDDVTGHLGDLFFQKSLLLQHIP